MQHNVAQIAIVAAAEDAMMRYLGLSEWEAEVWLPFTLQGDSMGPHMGKEDRCRRRHGNISRCSSVFHGGCGCGAQA